MKVYLINQIYNFLGIKNFTCRYCYARIKINKKKKYLYEKNKKETEFDIEVEISRRDNTTKKVLHFIPYYNDLLDNTLANIEEIRITSPLELDNPEQALYNVINQADSNILKNILNKKESNHMITFLFLCSPTSYYISIC